MGFRCDPEYYSMKVLKTISERIKDITAFDKKTYPSDFNELVITFKKLHKPSIPSQGKSSVYQQLYSTIKARLDTLSSLAPLPDNADTRLMKSLLSQQS